MENSPQVEFNKATLMVKVSGTFNKLNETVDEHHLQETFCDFVTRYLRLNVVNNLNFDIAWQRQNLSGHIFYDDAVELY